MGFFKSIFSTSALAPEEEKKKEEGKNFDIFKYDGIRSQNMGQLDYAVKCFGEALKIHDDEEVLAHLGQVLSIQGKLDEAFDVYSRLTETYPLNVESFLAFANVCFLLDKFDEMLAYSKGNAQVPVIVEGNKVTIGFTGDGTDGFFGSGKG